MDIKERIDCLIHELVSLVVRPGKFLRRKSGEEVAGSAVTGFFLPLVVLAGGAVVLGGLLWSSEQPLSLVLMRAGREIAAYLLQFVVASSVLFRLMQNFRGTASKARLNQVLVYSLFPFLLASIIHGLFPALYVLNVIGLYGFYLLVLGSQLCFGIPKERQTGFILLSVLMIILIFGTINFISWQIIQAISHNGA